MKKLAFISYLIMSIVLSFSNTSLAGPSCDLAEEKQYEKRYYGFIDPDNKTEEWFKILVPDNTTGTMDIEIENQYGTETTFEIYEHVCDAPDPLVSRNLPSQQKHYVSDINVTSGYYYLRFSDRACGEGQNYFYFTITPSFIAPVKIEGVPDYNQDVDTEEGYVYSLSGPCAPTAVACILGYWDNNGYGTILDDGERELITELQLNSNYKWHRIFVNDQTVSGTFDNSMCQAIEIVCNDSPNRYGFKTEQISSPTFDEFKSEIDSGRPVYLSLCNVAPYYDTDDDDDECHAVTGIGYDETNGQQKIIFYDNWKPEGEESIEWSDKIRSMIKVIPGPRNDVTISGRVTDGEGLGIEGVQVTFWRWDYNANWDKGLLVDDSPACVHEEGWTLEGSVFTDSNGDYTYSTYYGWMGKATITYDPGYSVEIIPEKHSYPHWWSNIFCNDMRDHDLTFDINDWDFVIDTGTASCTYSIHPNVITFSSNGGTQELNLVASSSYCPWTVSDDLSWIEVSPGGGSGDSTIIVTAHKNTSNDNRDGSFSIAGETVGISQNRRITPLVDAGDGFTVGLKSDGSVAAVGDNSDGQCNVDIWSDIKQVVAGASHTVGLKTDGSVVATGKNSAGQCDLEGWTDIQQLVAGGAHTVGLKADGTVVAKGGNHLGQCDVESWADIRQVAAGMAHTVGLKADGTVVAVGRSFEGQLDVESWTDIVQVSAGYMHTVGLRSNGIVVAVGDNRDGQCEVENWSSIKQIAAGRSNTLGLRMNGTVVAVGDNRDGQCEVENWSSIQQVAAGDSHTVGLKLNGSAVAVGYNYEGQCDVVDWSLIVANDPCLITIHPSSKHFSSYGGSIGLAVSTSDLVCSWSVVDNLSWVYASPETGIGAGNITLSVDQNAENQDRNGVINIAGHNFEISQEAYNNSVLSDSDYDGLPDGLEIESCTNLNDADTDDDGILDGEEDLNHNGSVDTGETNPCALDTDNDFLQDGTELGVEYDDIGIDTDVNVFQPDFDTSTTSDPTEIDTDNDGMIDGLEDSNHNGRVDLGERDPLPKVEGTVRWKLGIYAESDPVIGADGTIYVRDYGSFIDDESLKARVYALSSLGIQKWEFSREISGSVIKSEGLAIGSDGTIYAAIEKKVHALYPDGTQKWDFELGDYFSTGLAIDSDGVIYIGTLEAIYAINPDGTPKWTVESTDNTQLDFVSPSTPAIGNDGTIYFGVRFWGKIFALNPNGTLKWTYDTGKQNSGAPAIGQDGTIYIAMEESLYSLFPDGSLNWVFDAPDGHDLYASPVIAEDNSIYVGGDHLYCLDSSGELKWNYSPGSRIVSGLVIGKDGIIYFGTYNEKLFAVNPDGSERWNIDTEGYNGLDSSPVISDDGFLFIANSPVTYAINVSSTGLADSSWPIYCHDIRRTGRINRIELDSDKDGLPDEIETGKCTDPFDADTDDDGIPDGIEDVDHNGIRSLNETDPCNADSDGDGIQDGTELGVTDPIADPDGDGPILGTNTTTFISDLDPEKTTDPLDSDSDGDTYLDGQEDFNYNGAIDILESDPNDPNSIPVKLGDINGDGTVNLVDAVMAMQIMTGNQPGSAATLSADINEDGKLGNAELIYILQILAGGRQDQEDTQPPDLVSFEFIPKTIDTSTCEQEIIVTAQLTDDLSGLSTGATASLSMARFESISGIQAAEVYFGPDTQISGNARNGIYVDQMPLNQGSTAGEWRLAHISLHDQAGNQKIISESELSSRGFITRFFNTSVPNVSSLGAVCDFEDWQLYTDRAAYFTKDGNQVTGEAYNQGWSNLYKDFEGSLGISATVHIELLSGDNAEVGIRKPGIAYMLNGNPIYAQMGLLKIQDQYRILYYVIERNSEGDFIQELESNNFEISSDPIIRDKDINLSLVRAGNQVVFSLNGNTVMEYALPFNVSSTTTPQCDLYVWANSSSSIQAEFKHVLIAYPE